MKRHYVMFAVLALVAAVLMMFAGCGGQDSRSSAMPTATAGATVAGDPGRVIIGLKQANEVRTKSVLTSLGGQIRQQYQIIPAMAAQVPVAAIAKLKQDPNVAYVIPDAPCKASAQTLPWGIQRIHADTVFGAGDAGIGVKVAVIDTGIDTTHPDLVSNYAGGYNFLAPTAAPVDDNGHGTHVSGTIAAINNTIGVVGAGPAISLYALKVLDATGNGYFSDVISALQWCVTNKMQIANMSLGATVDPGSPVQAACDAAYAANVLLVAAAGNDGPGTDTVEYPAHYTSVIAVGATDTSDAAATFSSTGAKVEFVAPGLNINSTMKGGTYAVMSGTSMAAPHVAGVAALVIANGVTGAANVRSKLDSTAYDLGTAGRDVTFGYGLIDALKATGIAPAVGTITGKITNSSTGAIVAAKVQTDTGVSVTDSTVGIYTLTNVAAGTRTLTVTATNYYSQSVTVTLAKGQTLTQNFALVPIPSTGTVTGKVTDSATGKAISGAAVKTDTNQSATTNSSGVYTLSTVPTGSRTVTASATGYTALSSTVTVSANASATLNFKLVAIPATTGTISGTVTDTSNKAISGAKVTTDTGQSATTSSTGKFTLSSVPAGNRAVTAAANGYTSQTAIVQLAGGATVTLTFKLPKTGTVTVHGGH